MDSVKRIAKAKDKYFLLIIFFIIYSFLRWCPRLSRQAQYGGIPWLRTSIPYPSITPFILRRAAEIKKSEAPLHIRAPESVRFATVSTHSGCSALAYDHKFVVLFSWVSIKSCRLPQHIASDLLCAFRLFRFSAGSAIQPAQVVMDSRLII